MFILTGLGIFLLFLLALVLCYGLFTLAGGLIPVNAHFRSLRQGVEVGVSSNGVHLDFILPVVNHLHDWRQLLDPKHYETPLDENAFLSFGWGDKGFYLDIDTWAELTFKVAARAVLIPSKTLMHVTAHPTIAPKGATQSTRFRITEEQYQQLCDYIIGYFDLDAQGKVKYLAGKGYTPDDNFYQAVGSYHAFYTCNSWVNAGLKKIGVRTALWSPFDRGVFYQLEKRKAA